MTRRPCAQWCNATRVHKFFIKVTNSDSWLPAHCMKMERRMMASTILKMIGHQGNTSSWYISMMMIVSEMPLWGYINEIISIIHFFLMFSVCHFYSDFACYKFPEQTSLTMWCMERSTRLKVMKLQQKLPHACKWSHWCMISTQIIAWTI